MLKIFIDTGVISYAIMLSADVVDRINNYHNRIIEKQGNNR